MTNTELIEAAVRDAAGPLTVEEVLEATQIEDVQKARGLIYYLVNQKRLLKASPTDDGISRWSAPGIDDTAEPVRPIKVPAVRAPEAQSIKPTVASVMNLSMEADKLPHVCVNFGTGEMVISCRDDVVRIDSLAAAQNLHAQMEQAIAALGALDGR